MISIIVCFIMSSNSVRQPELEWKKGSDHRKKLTKRSECKKTLDVVVFALPFLLLLFIVLDSFVCFREKILSAFPGWQKIAVNAMEKNRNNRTRIREIYLCKNSLKAIAIVSFT